jgi:hypothetical protein
MGNHLRLSSVLLAAAAFAGQHAAAQAPPAAQPIVPAAQDPAIAAALRQVSAERIEASIARLVSFNNRSTLSSMDSGLPAGTGATAAADWLFAEFSRISADCGQCLEVKRDDFIEPGSSAPNSRIPKDTRLQNIYAVLKGTDPAQANRYVLVTGHYDSRNSDVMDTRDPAPGANDDASGVAVSLECARVLSKLKFPSTIVFVAADGEEQGLNGSRHLAKLARAEKWDLEAALDDDIVGGDKTPGEDTSAVRLFSEGVPNPATLDQLHTIQTYGYESDSPSREVARAIAEVDRTYFAPLPNFPPHAGHGPVPVLLNADFAGFHPVLEFRRDRFGRGGDHTSFNAEGFAAVRFTEWQENFNHQHQTPRTEAGELPDGSRGPVEFGDFLKFVDFNYVAKVARLNAAALATFAAAPGEPLDVRIPGGSSDNFSILSWKAPAGAPAGTTYEVVWRATAEPQWTHVASAGSALTLKLAVSKDDVVFGVRSVDAAGHRSPAVVPMPASRQTMSPSTPRRPQN